VQQEQRPIHDQSNAGCDLSSAHGESVLPRRPSRSLRVLS
jgi:hypothetical protein